MRELLWDFLSRYACISGQAPRIAIKLSIDGCIDWIIYFIHIKSSCGNKGYKLWRTSDVNHCPKQQFTPPAKRRIQSPSAETWESSSSICISSPRPISFWASLHDKPAIRSPTNSSKTPTTMNAQKTSFSKSGLVHLKNPPSTLLPWLLSFTSSKADTF